MALVDLISVSVSGQLRPSVSVPVAARPRDERPPDVVEVRRLGPRVVVVVGLAGVLPRPPALGLLVAQSLGRMCPQPVAEPDGMPTPRGVRPADVEDDPVAAMYVQPLLPHLVRHVLVPTWTVPAHARRVRSGAQRSLEPEWRESYGELVVARERQDPYLEIEVRLRGQSGHRRRTDVVVGRVPRPGQSVERLPNGGQMLSRSRPPARVGSAQRGRIGRLTRHRDNVADTRADLT